MAFGREIEHGARAVLLQQPGQQGAVADIPLHEHMARVALEAGEIVQVAGVGQLVEIDNGLVMGRKPVEYKIGTDKTCAACDQNHGEKCLDASRRSL